MTGLIYLVGFMGAGKSFFGKKWSAELHKKFIDLDDYIEQKTNKTITSIFTLYGEQNFRAFETEMLKEVSENFKDAVIACGGGTACFNNNMQYMNNQGTTIYLKASANALYERLLRNQSQRPLLKDKNPSELLLYIKDKLIERNPFYTLAKYCVDTEENKALGINEIKPLNNA
jgi:shikimate kinase